MNYPAAYMYVVNERTGIRRLSLVHPNTFDKTIKTTIPLYFSDSVMIGNYILTPIPDKPKKFYISHVSGEGGEFDIKKLELAIRAFFEDNF